MSKRMFLCGIAALCLGSSAAHSDVITDWDERAIAFVTSRMPPPQAQRVLAIVNAAMFDAVNSIEPRYRPYSVQVPNAKGASKEVAAATAATTVLAGLHPAAEAEFQKSLDTLLGRIPRWHPEIRWHQGRTHGGRNSLGVAQERRSKFA